MRIFHLSDLHIGKQLYLYSLYDVQKAILCQILEKMDQYVPDVVLICGDIYDKSVPSAEAYHLFDWFLKQLADRKPRIPVLIIAGNHDSAERLQYASRFLEEHGIFIAAYPPKKEGECIRKLCLSDENGEVNFYLLPFLKPGHVRHLFPEGVVTDYTSAVQAVLSLSDVDETKRNVLLAHQFFVNGSKQPETCESEQTTLSVGGLDSVDVSAVMQFDYVALGHLHGRQSIGAPHIRYCGTPLKYSVSEAGHNKSITMVTLGEKGTPVEIQEIPLAALQDVRRERGLLKDIISKATAENRHDFISVTITDEEEPFMPKQQLEAYYDHLLELKVDNSRTKALLQETGHEGTVLEPFGAFAEFYEMMQHCTMSEEETEIIKSVVAAAKEVE